MSPPPPSRDDRLEAYRAKRTASRTPEPFGGEVVAGGSVFVVQKHHARALHWDLRLELDGVLLSWAVPKGPSPNQADKRLAMRTEDHPLEYAEFEGVIPEGEYGAGSMIVWDRGTWTPVEDPRAGLVKGKLLFDLHGHKLQGRWTLVKTKQAENSWLLIKERDAWMDEEGGTGDYPDDSIYSGLEVDRFPRADEIAEELAVRVAEAGAPEAELHARDVEPMLATASEEAFTREGWLFEIKYDGYRLLAERHRRTPSLRSRNGHDLTPTFPEIARAVRGLPYEGLILDGEVVVHDAEGLPSFSRLQKRGRILNPHDALRASVELPATFYAFDLLAVEGRDLRGLPLRERKAFLRELLPTVGPIRYSDHIEEAGEAMFARVQEMGLEGVVAKKGDGRYVGGRSPDWVKVRTVQVEDFAVVGWTDPKGSRSGFGALHLAQRDGEGWTYLGSVGSGFDAGTLEEIARRLEGLEVPAPPVARGDPPSGSGHHWVRPEVVVEVRFKELTDAGLVRQASFSRLRDDKPPEDCVLQGPAVPPDAREPDAMPVASGERRVEWTNADKVFWPDAGLTKGDLLAYHERMAPWMLPYLRDRPLVMTRYPDGIEGKSFFQKDAPPYAPEWIRRATVWSESSERELSYFVADDVESLLYVVNLGTIPLHVWSSRLGELARPDWCVLDLDPKEAPFDHVVRIARLVHEVCEDIALPSFPKTSGSTGIHVLIPLAGRLTHEQSRTLAELLGRVVVSELPEIATLTRAPEKREGKVYVDYVQNGQGRLIVAPFSVRPRPGAPVSTPLLWEEVDDGLAIADHTLRTVPGRMEELGADPMAPVLELEPDLLGALEKLAGRF